MLENIIMVSFVVIGIIGFIYSLLLNNKSDRKTFKHDKISLSLAGLMSILIIVYLLLVFGIFGNGHF